jgi:hypothetical protein
MTQYLVDITVDDGCRVSIPYPDGSEGWRFILSPFVAVCPHGFVVAVPPFVVAELKQSKLETVTDE